MVLARMRLILIWIVFASTTNPGLAEDLKKADEAKTKKAKETPIWMQYLEASLPEYELLSPKSPKQKFSLTEKPLLVHTDPIEGEEQGLLYLWKDTDGRPVAAITGILMRFSPGDASWDELHEYHSLWHEPIRMQRNRSVVWQPSEPGVKWKEFRVDLKETKSSRMRQLQVNKVARRFKSKVDYRDRGEWNLRLITKPIYNYTYQNEDEDKLKQTVSGSVFAFCRSTDPEVLLMLESRTTKAGEKQWYWASVCFAGESSFLSLDGKEVWAEQPRFGSNIKHGSHFKIRTFNYVEALKRKQDIASKQ